MKTLIRSAGRGVVFRREDHGVTDGLRGERVMRRWKSSVARCVVSVVAAGSVCIGASALGVTPAGATTPHWKGTYTVVSGPDGLNQLILGKHHVAAMSGFDGANNGSGQGPWVVQPKTKSQPATVTISGYYQIDFTSAHPPPPNSFLVGNSIQLVGPRTSTGIGSPSDPGTWMSAPCYSVPLGSTPQCVPFSEGESGTWYGVQESNG